MKTMQELYDTGLDSDEISYLMGEYYDEQSQDN
jgi:hypothetical protein